MKRSKTEEVFDVTFIGAGPTGLFGAFYAGLREMSVKVIDALPQAGGQLIALYPEKSIFDTPGHPSIVSRELVSNLLKQTERWKPTMCFNEHCLDLHQQPLPGAERGEIYWLIETDRGMHYSRTVIIAAGLGAFQPVKLTNERTSYLNPSKGRFPGA